MFCRKIIVLSSTLLQEDGRFGNFEDGMYIGGQVRIEAAVHIAQKYPLIEFTLASGYNKSGHGDIETSEKVDQMAAFILARAPMANIQKVYSLPCTYHNFVAALRRYRSSFESQEVGILTNEYHLRRALEFANLAAQTLGYTEQSKFIPIAAEEVLSLQIRAIIGERTGEYAERVRSEAHGLKQLRAGLYEDSCLTRNFASLRHIIKKHGKVLLTDEELDSLRGKL